MKEANSFQHNIIATMKGQILKYQSLIKKMEDAEKNQLEEARAQHRLVKVNAKQELQE